MADLLVSGIIYGSIITLAAIGLTLMSDILKFFNFAYGDFFSLGAYGTLLVLGLLPRWAPFPGLSFGWGLILSLVIGIAIAQDEDFDSPVDRGLGIEAEPVP